MKDYAVIAISGKQYQVSLGDKITVDKQDLPPGETLKIDQVLLVRQGESVTIGTPYIEKVPVVLKVVADQKGDKIRVFKYKAKSRYRKTQGFRAQQTVMQVKSIGTSEIREKKAVKPVKPAVKKATKAKRTKLKTQTV